MDIDKGSANFGMCPERFQNEVLRPISRKNRPRPLILKLFFGENLLNFYRRQLPSGRHDFSQLYLVLLIPTTILTTTYIEYPLNFAIFPLNIQVALAFVREMLKRICFW